MLQNIVFQDDIFQIVRSVELIEAGLSLQLSENIFAEKLFNDIVFCHVAIHNVYEKLKEQTHLHDYFDAMQCMYFCETKYLQLLYKAIEIRSKDWEQFAVEKEKLEKIKTYHNELQSQIVLSIRDHAGSSDNFSIVSEVELSQLLKV